MKVSVKVPATSANLGPGFDCIGFALPIYNVITIEETILPGTGIEINVMASDGSIDKSAIEQIPTDENNIVYKAVEMLYNMIGQTPSELKITIESQIPIAKGLGSSSSVIVGGLLAANELLGKPADQAALLSIAAEVETHPDNIAPAILGGLVLSSLEDDGSVVYRKLDWPNDWQITVCIPNFELETDISRSVLPTEIPLKDAAFNTKRFGMFIDAIHRQDVELMKFALQDRIHQPYRAKLVPGLSEIVAQLKHEENVIGCVLSGAGPSLIVISQKNNLDKIKGIIKDTWSQLNVNVDIRTLKLEPEGAHIIDRNE